MQSITISKIIEKRAELISKLKATRRIVKEKIKQAQKYSQRRTRNQD